MIVPLAFLAIGAAVLAWGSRELQRAIASSTWPVVRGTIVSATLKSETDRDEPAMTLYSASIRYGYEIAWKQYEGERIAFSTRPLYGHSR